MLEQQTNKQNIETCQKKAGIKPTALWPWPKLEQMNSKTNNKYRSNLESKLWKNTMNFYESMWVSLFSASWHPNFLPKRLLSNCSWQLKIGAESSIVLKIHCLAQTCQAFSPLDRKRGLFPSVSPRHIYQEPHSGACFEKRPYWWSNLWRWNQVEGGGSSHQWLESRRHMKT